VDLNGWQNRPCWEDYEAELLGRGFQPYFDEQLEDRVRAAGLLCAHCGAKPVFVGMTNGKVDLGFVACGPACGDWFWFLPQQARS
jgi:hypothetical protein